MADSHVPQLGADGRIIEGLITTLNKDGTVNISPMGPIVDKNFRRFVLRPYQSSTTYQNLKRGGQAVFHVTDDNRLIAETAIGDPLAPPPMVRAKNIEGQILKDTCSWYALRITKLDDAHERTWLEASCIDHGQQRSFIGYNRAQHAVLETAILATRIHILPPENIFDDLSRLELIVTKTASEYEKRAFDFLHHYIESNISASSST